MSSAMEKARRIIQNDSKKDAHIIKERMQDRSKIINKTVQGSEFDNLMPSYSSSYSPVINENDDHGSHGEYLDEQLARRMQTLRESVHQSAPQSYETPRKVVPNKDCKLPREIIESFQNEQLDYSKLNNDSVLDFVDIKPIERQEQIVEEYRKQPVAQNNSNIDYSLIKNIIESAVKKYIGAYTKKILNESKSNGLSDLKAIKMGDTFSFITENGDVFEANLTFKRNINDKKK